MKGYRSTQENACDSTQAQLHFQNELLMYTENAVKILLQSFQYFYY
jgi:hypothetical protein